MPTPEKSRAYLNTDLPPGDLALVEAYQNTRQARAKGWRSLILAGYLPYIDWRRRMITWSPTPALEDLVEDIGDRLNS